jgi:choline-sulfatase
MYRPEDVVLRENVAPDMGTNRWEWEARTYLWDFRYYRDHLPYTRNLPEGFDLRALTALYYGAITWVDDTVGALMAALHQSGLAENTIVIVTADHGDNLGSHRRMGKCTLNEESIRVPYLAWAPGRLAPRVVDRQVCSLLDLAPTLLAMADVETPPTMQGRNLTPVLTGERDALEDDWAVIECIGDGAGVRTPTHLYGLPWAGGHRALGETPHCHHDLREDPWEQHTNPAPDARLDGILRDWLARTPWLAEGAP